MGIKLDPQTKTFTVSYSKRHPKTNQPISLKRIGVDTESKAKRIYQELVVKVSEKIKKVTAPPWEDILDQYYKFIQEADLRSSTVYKRDKTLRKHTLPAWKGKFVDEIKTQDIYELVQTMVGTMAESHRKFIVKGLRGVFTFALERGYINRNQLRF